MNFSSPLDAARAGYRPKMPASLHELSGTLRSDPPPAISEDVRSRFPRTFDLPTVTFVPNGTAPTSSARPLRVGVILSGGPAPGGHNVIAGLLDALNRIHPGSTLHGFLNGPAGVLNDAGRELDGPLVDRYRNTGGFDLIGSGRTKLESESDFRKAMETIQARELTGLVVIGGNDSNTNACMLAEYASANGSPLCVVGIPKTIDGDLKGPGIETSFGFDTACKVYSELVGNINRDALSVRKYWHFIKLMGRSASHIALECALQTRPTITLISEEVAHRELTLHEIVDHIADIICYRANRRENFGTILIPEGLVEFVPEMHALIGELNETIAGREKEFQALMELPHKREFVTGCLSPSSAGLYRRLPREIANQLILDRDPHGTVQVAKIDTQRLFIELVDHRLREMAQRGIYDGTFVPQAHYLGYEGRCAAPSNFDADYTYTLGFTAALLLRENLTGTMATVRNLARPATEWVAGGIPLSRLMHFEHRHGEDVPVIRKALVDLDGPVFKALDAERAAWAKETQFAFPGPLQYFGPPEVCDRTTITLQLETSV
ncbi:MAG TPA: diphosphate--fructose-6-phosphate 1-phosphotransferase [Chthoniobacterales bacterium]|nr:diphosphate--fructose-6-phosphate 1-phosphotransferase [Chthoniobacterales bacterium]